MKKYHPRSLTSYLKRDLKEKILILTGPRQSGKTLLSQNLFSQKGKYDYLNYFDSQDRLHIEKKEWDRKKSYVVFDELHIKKNWKRWLKSLYEKEKMKQGIIVTGSAELETYKRSGDSLAGCFFSFRLHPLDLKELCEMDKKQNPEIILHRLLETGGFPEPYFKGNRSFYNRWAKTHTEAILKEDMMELERQQRISHLNTLLELLKSSVGSPIQYETLSRTLQCDGKTVKKMLALLENFYFIFKVSPYFKNIQKSIRKSPKYYFYDIAQIPQKGPRFENLIACALLKNNHFKEDCLGEKRGLFYLRNKDKREIDFLVTKNAEPSLLLEAKWKENKLSTHFDIFAKNLPKDIKRIQVVRFLDQERTTVKGHEIRKASNWLRKL